MDFACRFNLQNLDFITENTTATAFYKQMLSILRTISYCI